jgi:hypothetical protein
MQPTPATSDFAAALPDRPIAVRPPATIRPQSSIARFTVLVGLLVGALWWLGPDLARDWRIRRDTIAARDARMGEARCLSAFRVLRTCDVPFSEGADTGSRWVLWYFYLDMAEPGPIVLLRDGSAPDAGPETITTNLGLDKLYHRLFTLVVIVAILMLLFVTSVRALRTGTAARRAFQHLNGQRLSPVVVALDGSFLTGLKRRRWTYLYDDAGGRPGWAFVELSNRTEPLYAAQDGKRALAVTGPGGGVPMLLDADLSALDLTATEKEAFFEVCRSALAGRPPE